MTCESLESINFLNASEAVSRICGTKIRLPSPLSAVKLNEKMVVDNRALGLTVKVAIPVYSHCYHCSELAKF